MTKCLKDFLSVSGEGYTVFHGSNLDVLPLMADNSVDSIVTDPPYELGFMGKSWDSSGIAYSVELWAECLRVLKPGGHLLAFSGSRTYHRMVVAIEDAGFEIRDMVSWISNKTFPKSLDISKAIDRAAGAKREIVGSRPLTGTGKTLKSGFHQPDGTGAGETIKQEVYEFTVPATPEAKKWAGWGTALKPSVEPIVLARKPLIGTVAENVLTWGVGGLNIDGSRIGSEVITTTNGKGFAGSFEGGVNNNGGSTHIGRWPANIILDEYTAQLLDEQSGHSKSVRSNRGEMTSSGSNEGWVRDSHKGFSSERGFEDSGGASRFFYVARASKRDRNEGLDELPAVGSKRYGDRNAGTLPQQTPQSEVISQNFHPTVKPTDLMRYLIKLVTPAGGLVLDPFTGSGSTGKAALLDGYKFTGIELTADYLPIIEGRLKWAAEQANKQEEEKEERLF